MTISMGELDLVYYVYIMYVTIATAASRGRKTLNSRFWYFKIHIILRLRLYMCLTQNV